MGHHSFWSTGVPMKNELLLSDTASNANSDSSQSIEMQVIYPQFFDPLAGQSGDNDNNDIRSSTSSDSSGSEPGHLLDPIPAPSRLVPASEDSVIDPQADYEHYFDAHVHKDAQTNHKNNYLFASFFVGAFAVLRHFVVNEAARNEVVGTLGLSYEFERNLETFGLLLSCAALYDLCGGVNDTARYPDWENIRNTLRPTILLPLFATVFGAMIGTNHAAFPGQTGEQTGAAIGGYSGFMLTILIVMGCYIWKYDERREIQREHTQMQQRLLLRQAPVGGNANPAVPGTEVQQIQPQGIQAYSM